jgi:phenylalanyl-tRNA synthetase alpha chain
LFSFHACTHSHFRGSWKTSTFKKYNFEAEGIPTTGGAFHPLLKVREEFRNIFLEMGYSVVFSFMKMFDEIESSFVEMPTNSFVESGFWCFDTLFVPQQHPARELQDTFYLSGVLRLYSREFGRYNLLSDPSQSLSPPKDYYNRISKVHERGGYGSIGYRAPWSHQESAKLLLRTHTTASSAAMLYKLAARCRGEDVEDLQEFAHSVPPGEKVYDDGFRPVKLFSIDRVFRNETLDATHLAEFHQVEGVVADRGLTLADLIG